MPELKARPKNNGGKKPSAAKTPRPRLACLRGPTTFSDKTVKVDKDAGVISNVSLMSIGATIGHPFTIDAVTIEQLVSLAGGQPDGVKCRFKHPPVTEKEMPNGDIMQEVGDDTGTLVGRIKNIRADGNQARGDIYLGGYSAVMPTLGNVREYLLLHAEEDPAGIGMSAMFSYDAEPVFDDFGNASYGPARLYELTAIDFVGKPAANPAGLLSAAATFDPRPPSGHADTPGWQDPKPADQAKSPIPAGTPEFPMDVRGDYLRAISKHGPMPFSGLAAHFSGRLEAMRAGADWLVSHGYAKKSTKGLYEATPAGITAAAMNFNK